MYDDSKPYNIMSMQSCRETGGVCQGENMS